MDFDVFEQLSDLETRVYVLEKELEEKNHLIQALLLRNTQLEQEQLAEKPSDLKPIADLEGNCDLATLTNGQSIADALKETSESTVSRTGYSFDECTGLYFDQKSGYYYDPDNCLFFEPKHGVYYKYNTETGEYTYQSSVDRDYWEKHFKNIIPPSSPRGIEEIASSKYNPHGDVYSSPKHRRLSPSIHKSRYRRHRSRRSPSSTSRTFSSPSRSRHGRSIRLRSTSHSSLESASSIRSGHSTSRRMKRTGKRKHDTDHSSQTHREHSSKRYRFRHQRYGTSSSSEDRMVISKASRQSPVQEEDAPTSLTSAPVVYPPGLRLVILASDYAALGSVFILTNTEASKGWGCIGRNPTFCPSVNFIDDPEVSTIHCEVIYQAKREQYLILDRESSSGTFVNGTAVSKKRPRQLSHGDVLRIGSSRLLVHIHRGLELCAQCDPESVEFAMALTNPKEPCDSLPTPSAELRLDRETERRSNLDMLKEKYGLKHCPQTLPPNDAKLYNDRAAQRRKIQANLKASGLDDSSASNVTVKLTRSQSKQPQVPNVNVPLQEDNKGAKLLSKMGWTPGQGLGKDSSGIVEPVTVQMRLNAHAGFGSSSSASMPSNISIPKGATRQEIQTARLRAITRERYDKLN